MEYMSMTQCIKAAKIDATLISSNVESYVVNNKFQYHVLCNTWVGIVRHHNEAGAILLADTIETEGLIDCIQRAQADVSAILHMTDEPKPFLSLLCNATISVADALQILRYPKRFSPFNADKLANDAFSDLLRINNNIKMRDRRGYPQYIIDCVKPYTYKLCEQFRFLPEKGYFSSGAVSDASTCKVDKILAWKDPYFLYPEYPLIQKYPERYCGSTDEGRIARCIAVPKSYKAPRIIAEEAAYRQWMLLAIKNCLEESIKASPYADNYIPENQDRNRRLCYESSLMAGPYATVDLSHASDSISCSLAHDLLPWHVMKVVDEYRSTNIEVNGKVHPCYILATSGAGNCFDQESIIFLGIALAATEITEVLTCESLYAPSIYGDDCIIDMRAYDTFCDFLHALGFTVNADKSFAAGGYRESCGVEFYDGIETTTVYFPRKPISPTPEGIQSLIELHNKLWKFYPYATTFLKKTVKAVCERNKWYYSTTSEQDYIELGEVSDLLSHKTSGSRSSVDPHYGDLLRPVAVHDRTYTNHMKFDTRNIKSSKMSLMSYDTRNVEMFYYVQHLLYGPQYDDDVSALLHVSSSRRNADDYYSKSELVIRMDKGDYER